MNKRYYLIEDAAYIEDLKIFEDKVSEIDAKRRELFKEWGSNHFLTYENQNITAMEDPRLFERPRKLPRGWKKVRSGKHKGYVEPSNDDNKRLLKSLNYPWETKVTSQLMNYISSIEENSKRVGTMKFEDDGKSIWWWATGGDDLGYIFRPKINYFKGVSQWVLVIPDPLLKIDFIPGTKELKNWEYEKMLDEHHEWWEKQKEAVFA